MDEDAESESKDKKKDKEVDDFGFKHGKDSEENTAKDTEHSELALIDSSDPDQADDRTKEEALREK